VNSQLFTFLIFLVLDMTGQVMRGGDKKFFWVLLFTLFTF